MKISDCLSPVNHVCVFVFTESQLKEASDHLAELLIEAADNKQYLECISVLRTLYESLATGKLTMYTVFNQSRTSMIQISLLVLFITVNGKMVKVFYSFQNFNLFCIQNIMSKQLKCF